MYDDATYIRGGKSFRRGGCGFCTGDPRWVIAAKRSCCEYDCALRKDDSVVQRG